MSLPLWPSTILAHEPLNESYQTETPDPLIRTDFEQGPSRQIQAYTNAPGFSNGVWPMSPAQKFIFDGFYKNDLRNGSAWFNIPAFTNIDYQLLKSRFVKGSVKFSRSGGEWMCAWRLEHEDVLAPSEEDTAIAMLTYGTDQTLEELVDALHHIIHVDYPAAVP